MTVATKSFMSTHRIPPVNLTALADWADRSVRETAIQRLGSGPLGRLCLRDRQAVMLLACDKLAAARTAVELGRRVRELEEENQRLRAELAQRPLFTEGVAA